MLRFYIDPKSNMILYMLLTHTQFLLQYMFYKDNIDNIGLSYYLSPGPGDLCDRRRVQRER